MKLEGQIREVMRFKHGSLRTEESYVGWYQAERWRCVVAEQSVIDEPRVPASPWGYAGTSVKTMEIYTHVAKGVGALG